MTDQQSAIGNQKSAITLRWDLLALAFVVALALGLLAAVADRGFSRPVDVAFSPLPTVTPTAAPTPGWWAAVPVIATPALPGLPGLPQVSLSGGGAGQAAGAPVPFSVLSCPRGDVKITAVTTGGKAGWWNVAGTAANPNQEYWKGEISADGAGWTMLYRSNAAVRDGLLIEFNTRTVPAGAYQIRLLAVDRTGNYPEPCVIRVSTG